MALDDGLFLLISWNFLLLIAGGCVAASWLLIRLSSVSDSEDISSLTQKVALMGFPVGILSILMTGAIFYLNSQPIGVPSSVDIVTLFCLGIMGLVLILRPIKDFKFGTVLSLAIGLLGAAILVFLGANSVKIVAGFFILLFLLIYGAVRLVEDLYLIIAEILSHPLISVIIGAICIFQGLLQIFSFSL
ncbi:MAG: hypothetical protein KAT16_08460, partial [Candidatus Heimdallarchaeota archaeon]|nr:hypothetical protein [Candidatus Heimdallarchaeota archaeon]